MDIKTAVKENKNTVTLVVIVVLIFVAYWFLSRGSEPLLSVTVRAPEQDIIGRELLVELDRLRSLDRIDTGFFNDPIFQRLKDNSVRPIAQPIGRTNPLVPPELE